VEPIDDRKSIELLCLRLMSATFILGATLSFAGLSLVTYYVPIAFVHSLNWHFQEAAFRLQAIERTLDDNPTLVYQVQAATLDTNGGVNRVIQIYPISTDNFFLSRDSAETDLVKYAKTNQFYWHPCFPWMKFVALATSAKGMRAIRVRLSLSAVVLIVALVALVLGL